MRAPDAVDDSDIDPPLRMATGIRLPVRRAHEYPAMGRSLVRFGGAPLPDLPEL